MRLAAAKHLPKFAKKKNKKTCKLSKLFGSTAQQSAGVPTVPFLSPVSGTLRNVHSLTSGQPGSSTLSCRNYWPLTRTVPWAWATTISEIQRCNVTLSELNRQIQILQILSMNITNRIRTKSQPGQNPNLC